ncbi:MAG: TetR/AcrR family transcriptional regulator [Pyrodictiaceae archaeon]
MARNMEKSQEDVRERIIAASMKVFSKYGFFKAPVKLVAMEAGVSKGLVFWYFRRKDELIVEVALRSLPAEVIEQCIKSGGKGKELLRCIGRKYLEKYRNEMYKNLLLHTLAAEAVYPRVREEVRKICENYTREVALRVYGEDSPRTRTAIRAFFGGLLCYVLRPPMDIKGEEYVENLIKLIAP